MLTLSSRRNEVPFCPIIAGKAQPISTQRGSKSTVPKRQPAFTSLLSKRRSRYRKRKVSSRQRVNSESDPKKSLEHSTTNRVSIDPLRSDEESLHLQQIELLHIHGTDDQPIQDSKRSGDMISSNFVRMGCKELADHVVTNTKVRLKKRRKRPNMLNDPACKPVLLCQRKPVLLCQRKPVIVCHRLPRVCCSSRPTSSKKPTSKDSIRTSLESRAIKKVVYLSESHSVTPKETGIPNVPPSTPTSCMLYCS